MPSLHPCCRFSLIRGSVPLPMKCPPTIRDGTSGSTSLLVVYTLHSKTANPVRTHKRQTRYANDSHVSAKGEGGIGVDSEQRAVCNGEPNIEQRCWRAMFFDRVPYARSYSKTPWVKPLRRWHRTLHNTRSHHAQVCHCLFARKYRVHGDNTTMPTPYPKY